MDKLGAWVLGMLTLTRKLKINQGVKVGVAQFGGEKTSQHLDLGKNKLMLGKNNLFNPFIYPCQQN